jgi:hypothetical protein
MAHARLLLLDLSPPLPPPILSDIFEVGDKQQVDHIKRTIWLIDTDRPTTGIGRQKIRMVNRYFAAIRQMDHEWPKWFRGGKCFELLNCHLHTLKRPTHGDAEIIPRQRPTVGPSFRNLATVN